MQLSGATAMTLKDLEPIDAIIERCIVERPFYLKVLASRAIEGLAYVTKNEKAPDHLRRRAFKYLREITDDALDAERQTPAPPPGVAAIQP
jgi:hypothetical protein